jgi:O-antigen/teichoic acid export membrane protein
MIISLVINIYFFEIKTIWAYIYSLYFSYGITAVTSFFAVIPVKNDTKPVKITLIGKEVFSFGFMTQLASTMQLINRRFSFYFINPMLGRAPLGIYNAGLQVSEGLKIIGQSISLVQYSAISNRVGQDEYNKQLTLSLLKFTVVFTILALIVLLILPASLYAKIFGEGFEQIKIVIFCLSPGIIALAASMIFSHFFSGTGRPKYNMIASLIGFITTAVAIYPMVKFFGFVGAGLMTSIAFTCGTVYQLIVFIRISGAIGKEFLITRKDVLLLKDLFTKFISRP